MAEQKLLKITIAQVDGPLFDGQVVSATLPGQAGEMTVMANHEAIISPLKAGIILLKRADNSEETFTIKQGTLELSNNHATILV